jgi:hypothetical protein
MLRLFALLMICVLTLSHGTMGAATPHAPGSAIDHAHDHVVETASAEDHHEVQADVAQGDETGNTDESAMDADVAHVHPAADEVRLADAIGPRLVLRDVRDPPVPDALLAPVKTAPLLEPPAA